MQVLPFHLVSILVMELGLVTFTVKFGVKKNFSHSRDNCSACSPPVGWICADQKTNAPILATGTEQPS